MSDAVVQETHSLFLYLRETIKLRPAVSEKRNSLMEELSSIHALFAVLLLGMTGCGYLFYFVTRFRQSLRNYPYGAG